LRHYFNLSVNLYQKVIMTLYSVKEVAQMKGKNVRTITDRVRQRMIEPIKKQGSSGYYFTQEQIDEMFRPKLNVATGEIIYIHTTWIILESKINFNN